jgi:RNA 2',3'-cyclic 3'-phosphodiesterase
VSSEDERSGRVRAFFALPLAEAQVSSLLDAQARMKGVAARLAPRWQPAEKLHVTLAFLGWVEEALLGALWPTAARLAQRTPALEGRIDAIDAFPGPAKARVLVASVVDRTGLLAELAGALEAAASELGVPPEDRAYRPHVTLARIKRPGNVRRWIGEARFEPLPVRFDELRLYRSELTSEGGRYSVLERAALGGGV